MGVSMISPEGLAIKPLIPANCFICAGEPLAPESAIIYKGLNPSRSRSPEYSVMSGVCTHLGCAPKYFPEVAPKPWDATWSGGFFCPCHGSMFDIVGRVFKGEPAPTKLVVPPQMVEGSILTIGEDKDL